MNKHEHTITYNLEPLEKAAERAAIVSESAESLIIDCPEMADVAAEELKGIKAHEKEVKAARDAITRPLILAKQHVETAFAEPLGFLSAAEAKVKAALADWIKRQEEARREAEAAERARREAEAAQIVAEQSKLQAEALTTASKADDPAAKLQAAQDAAEKAAEASMQLAALMSAPLSTISTKVAGASKRTTWSAETFDLMALAQAVIDGHAPAEAIQPNTTFLNQQARAFKRPNLYPGVRGVQKETIAAR